MVFRFSFLHPGMAMRDYAMRGGQAGLVDDVTSHIWYKSPRDADAFRGLVVLEDRGNDAREGKRRAVQRMAELRLFGAFLAVSALQTVCLICIEV